jgi:hypothetical protein
VAGASAIGAPVAGASAIGAPVAGAPAVADAPPARPAGRRRWLIGALVAVLIGLGLNLVLKAFGL